MKRLVIIVAAIGAVSWLWFLRFGLSADNDSSYTQMKIATSTVREGLSVPLRLFKITVGRYPTTEEGLSALFRCPSGSEKVWKGPYVEKSDGAPLDPWRSPYQYRSPGIHNPDAYDVWSLGPDLKMSDDDIGNWKR